MENTVGNIFYFGSLKDGFKVYPNLGAISNLFASYYTNTATEWILIVTKSKNITRYTYVKYELLTSATEGRTGSCLGISIEFIDTYFTDLMLLHDQVIQKIWEAFLTENILLEKQENSQYIAFKPYNLNEVSQYLDNKSHTIRKVINETYNKNIQPSNHIPDANNNYIYGLNPKSSFKTIIDFFETYGTVKISPSDPINNTPPPKIKNQETETQKEGIQKPSNKDEIQHIYALMQTIREKDSEINLLKQQINQLTADFNKSTNLSNQQSNQTNKKLENNKDNHTNLNQFRKTQELTLTFQPSRQHHFDTFPETTKQNKNSFTTNSTQIKTNKFSTNIQQKSINIIKTTLASILALITFLMIGKWLASSKNSYLIAKNSPETSQNNEQLNTQSKQQENHPVIRLEGKRGLLIADTFLKDNQGTNIPDQEAFKQLLTSYLIRKDPVINTRYNADQQTLWKKIVQLNPQKEKEINSFIKQNLKFNNYLTIDQKDSNQKQILENLIVY